MKVYILWHEDAYVNQNGNTDPPDVLGVFSSLEAMNSHMQANWIEYPIDPRKETPLSNENKRIKWSKPSPLGYDFGSFGEMYFEEHEVAE